MENKLYEMFQHGAHLGDTEVVMIGNIKVAAKFAANLKLLMDAAAAHGFPLDLAAGFRTMQEQIQLRRQNVIGRGATKLIQDADRKAKQSDDHFLITADNGEFSPRTAKPGYSDHQCGWAYDFSVMQRPKDFDWLCANAIDFGFVRTVPSERWHWEYLPGVGKYEGWAGNSPDHFSWAPATIGANGSIIWRNV